LQRSDLEEGDIARREWTYLPFLSRAHHMPPLVLHRVLARDLALFAEVVSAAFRAHHRDQNEIVSDEERARARVAHDCLSSWHIVPGTDAGARLMATG
jgi:hypothetical protein